jgi:hypothetical protein
LQVCQFAMTLHVQRAVVPFSAGTTTATCCAAPRIAAAAGEEEEEEHAEGGGLLFDEIVLDSGSDEDSSPTGKLEWLRSQTIGADAEFVSPFGIRRITYADHTASGRCLRFAEEFVMQNVLPYYGQCSRSILVTFTSITVRRALTRVTLGGWMEQETLTRRTATWACTRASWPATRHGT